MLTKEQFLDELLKFNTGYDTDLIGKAYDKAKMLHEGQFRKSGEPYFIHPIAVAIILAGLGMDDTVPDSTTLCRFRNALVKSDVYDRLL